jgi:pimeloyl-ACP methyl ester carboxylesterase
MIAGEKETIRLRDGRLLEFVPYGVAGGKPVFFFHGFIGSHNQGALLHEAAQKHGVRLIALHRPGIGRSSLGNCRRLTDSAEDVRQLADALGLAAFGLLSFSGGCMRCLSCLFRLPDRVRVAGIVGGFPPFKADPNARARLGVSKYPMSLPLFLARYPWSRFLVRRRYERMAALHRRDPRALLRQIVSAWPRNDQEQFATHAWLVDMFLGDLEETYGRGQGAAGLVEEIRLGAGWSLPLRDLPRRTKVFLFHGREDRSIRPRCASYLAKQLPNAELHWHEGGHFSMPPDVRDNIVRRLSAGFDHGNGSGC